MSFRRGGGTDPSVWLTLIIVGLLVALFTLILSAVGLVGSVLKLFEVIL